MSDEPHVKSRDELDDQLVDRHLRELLGGDAPPDLSKRILTAACGLASEPLVPAGGHAMNAVEPSPRKSGISWLTLAVAVCLLIGGAALLLPAIESHREASDLEDLALAADAPAPALPAAGPAAPVADPADDEQFAEGEAGAGFPYLTVRGPRDHYEGDGQTPAGPASTTFGVMDGLLVSGSGINADAGAPVSGTNRYAMPTEGVDGGYGGGGRGMGFGGRDGGGRGGMGYSQAGGGQQAASGGEGGQGAGGGNGEEAPATAADWMPMSAEQLAKFPNYTVDLDMPYRQGSFGLSRESLARESLQMMVTPGIIIAEEEEEARLGVEMGGEALGTGPQAGGDQYAPIIENPFRAISPATTDNRLSTFSIDVDTAAYANVRQFLMQSGTLPPPDAVRIEELVNYFDYDYAPPTGDVPFAANVEVAGCPWAPAHRLVRVGIKGREIENGSRPKSNLVFLIDVSGSMDEPAKLPLLVEGMKMLARELGENDRVAIVVYASSEGLALDSTRGDQQQTILDALGRLSAGGSTAGGAGIALAYSVAEQNFIKGGVNRIVLCTDGDFNVGVTSPAELQRLAEEKAKATGVFLTVIGFGRGNLNDAMMEQVADHGNGNYHYVDNLREARKVLVEEMTGTLVTIAKDVKIQIEFNPLKVAGYRLIGYENRVLAAEDFNDDKKDAGEIGAGHTVTALYEVVPAGQKVDATAVDELKYAPPATPSTTETADAEESAPMSDELLTLKIRYKQPDGDESTKLEFPIADSGQNFSAASGDFQFASAVASFGMLLRGSQYRGDATLAGVLEIAESAKGDHDELGYRQEFVEMLRRARELSGQ